MIGGRVEFNHSNKERRLEVQAPILVRAAQSGIGYSVSGYSPDFQPFSYEMGWCRRDDTMDTLNAPLAYAR